MNLKRLPVLHQANISKSLLFINIVIALIYLSWWFVPGHAGNPILYGLLLFGEVYHVGLAILFWFTLWPGEKSLNLKNTNRKTPRVDVFITVAGEPVDVVQKTAMAAKNIDYPNFQVYLLNDGYVAKKDNWQDIEDLTRSLNISCITRKTPGGAKAGNINNALKETQGELITIFDADMVPHSDFLRKLTPYFKDPEIGFVQSPQFYQNNQLNNVTASAWEQQELFFGPIMKGKNKSNASFICGTNVVIRREALLEAGGMNEQNIAEDFLTSLVIHQKGWKSHYVSEVLAEGLAPEDLLAYYTQQFRWARGSLEVLFGYNPLFNKSLTWKQKFEYLSSGLYYLNGVVVLIDLIMPILFMFTGLQPVAASTTNFALFFIPFIIASLTTLSMISQGSFSFKAMSFSHCSWFLQLQAVVSVLLRKKIAFAVTPKKGQQGNYISLALPHITYVLLLLIGTPFALINHAYLPAVITNFAWGLFNVIFFIPFIASSVDLTTLFNWNPTPEVVESSV